MRTFEWLLGWNSRKLIDMETQNVIKPNNIIYFYL